MKDKRVKGQSQLDYLWVNYGIYSVSDKKETDANEYIPTQSLVLDLLKQIEDNSVGSISLQGNTLIVYSTSGTVLQRITLPEGVGSGEGASVIDFGLKTVTQDDITNGCPFPVGTNVYYLTLSTGRQFWTKTLKGTSTIHTYIEDDEIKSEVIVDNSGNVKFSTDNGLKADVELVEKVSSLPIVGEANKIYLLETDEGSQAYIFVDGLYTLIGGGEDLQLRERVDNIELTLTWNEF